MLFHFSLYTLFWNFFISFRPFVLTSPPTDQLYLLSSARFFYYTLPPSQPNPHPLTHTWRLMKYTHAHAVKPHTSNHHVYDTNIHEEMSDKYSLIKTLNVSRVCVCVCFYVSSKSYIQHTHTDTRLWPVPMKRRRKVIKQGSGCSLSRALHCWAKLTSVPTPAMHTCTHAHTHARDAFRNNRNR